MAVRKRKWSSGGKDRTAWVVDYKDGQGKRRLKTFSTKKDADAWASQTHVDVRRGTHVADGASKTIQEAADLWLARLEAEGRERNTLVAYRRHVRLHIAPELGSTRLTQFTAPDAEAFRDRLLEKHSRPMARKVLTSLKSVLYDAQRRGLVGQNVASKTTIDVPKRHRKRVVPPTMAEVQQLIAAASDRWRPFVVVAAMTGLRASELRALRWQDAEDRVIHVRQRADEWGTIGAPKSEAGFRDIPIGKLVSNTLKEWKLRCPASRLDLVFPNGKGNVESYANIRQRGFDPMQIEAGLTKDGKPKYGLHALRHFYASWLIHQGYREKEVQSRLGHESIVMTMDLYAHLWPDEGRDQERLDAAELALVG